MKLSIETTRELLLWIEENLQYSYDGMCVTVNQLNYTDAAEALGIDCETILYTSERLAEAGYIDAYINGSDIGISICIYQSITYSGHEYLDAIRNKTVLNKIINAVKQSTGTATLDIVKKLATAMIQSQLHNFLGLPPDMH